MEQEDNPTIPFMSFRLSYRQRSHSCATVGTFLKGLFKGPRKTLPNGSSFYISDKCYFRNLYTKDNCVHYSVPFLLEILDRNLQVVLIHYIKQVIYNQLKQRINLI